MKKAIVYSSLMMFVVALFLVPQSYSDDSSEQTLTLAQAGTAEKAAEEKPKAKRKAPAGRLPNYYGQVGLSDDQRDKVYAVQNKYRGQIDELVKQITALREKEREEIDAILTADQLKKLEEIKAEAIKRIEERRKAREAEAARTTAK